MSNQAEDNSQSPQSRRFASVVREVKNALADRDDVVVELREASRTRLEILATELQPFFDDVPAEMEMFDFTISSGLKPRLWIDAVSHVAMSHDRRTYRFVRDTRAGRVVLAEDTAIRPVADQIARYVAERVLERERLMEGSAEPSHASGPPAQSKIAANAGKSGWLPFLSGIGLVAAGALVGLIASVMALWDRLLAAFGPVQ